MPKKRRDRAPEYILCANPDHGIPLRHTFIAEHFRVTEGDEAAPRVHHQWSVGPPHGTFRCPACGHDTIRHFGPNPG